MAAASRSASNVAICSVSPRRFCSSEPVGIVSERDIDLIVFAIHDIDAKRREKIIADCSETASRTVMAPDFLSFVRDEITASDGDGNRGTMAAGSNGSAAERAVTT